MSRRARHGGEGLIHHMFYRFCLRGLTLTVCALAAAGCRLPSPGGPQAAKSAAAAVQSAAKSPGDQAVQRLARAHAHFAASVIHDMNGESEAAAEDLYQAGLEDPQDEALVLEASRRLLTQ